MPDREICTSGRLLPLLAEDTDADVSFQDHADVVGAIANGQGDLLWESRFDHLHNIRLLLWGDSTSKDDVHLVGGSQELASQGLKGVDDREGVSSHNDGLLPWLPLRTACLLHALYDAVQRRHELACARLLNDVLIHLAIQELRGDSDVDSGLDLIACEHPDLDSNGFHELDG